MRSMTPAQRLAKAFELSAFTKSLFMHGFRKRHPEASEVELRKIMLEHLARWRNQNY